VAGCDTCLFLGKWSNAIHRKKKRYGRIFAMDFF